MDKEILQAEIQSAEIKINNITQITCRSDFKSLSTKQQYYFLRLKNNLQDYRAVLVLLLEDIENGKI